MSNYVLDQYNKKVNDDDGEFMTIPDEANSAIAVVLDSETNIGVDNLGTHFFLKDEALHIIVKAGTHYYFHGRIRKMPWVQIFDIKLYNSESSANIKTQYIKTITVESGGNIEEEKNNREENWVDVEFIFTPQFKFDHIVFLLQRGAEDFLRSNFSDGRPAIIAYQEVSEIKNVISNNKILKVPTGIGLIKIGVQSRPGLLMCINGEEIRISRIGIYELKNGIMTTNFFSVCGKCPDKDKSGELSENEKRGIDSWTDEINEEMKNILQQPDPSKRYYDRNKLKSYSFTNIDYKGSREIPRFTIDYLYRTD